MNSHRRATDVQVSAIQCPELGFKRSCRSCVSKSEWLGYVLSKWESTSFGTRPVPLRVYRWESTCQVAGTSPHEPCLWRLDFLNRVFQTMKIRSSLPALRKSQEGRMKSLTHLQAFPRGHLVWAIVTLPGRSPRQSTSLKTPRCRPVSRLCHSVSVGPRRGVYPLGLGT